MLPKVREDGNVEGKDGKPWVLSCEDELESIDTGKAAPEDKGALPADTV